MKSTTSSCSLQSPSFICDHGRSASLNSGCVLCSSALTTAASISRHLLSPSRIVIPRAHIEQYRLMTKIISKMQRFGAIWSLIEEMRKENSHLIEPELFVVLAAEGVKITYVSAIKLVHEKTKFRLHSHNVPYGSGSGPQSVTSFPGVVDSNSYWIRIQA